MTAVAVHLIVPCPACEGHGETYVEGSGDPRGPNAEYRRCWGCAGEHEVDSARADEIRDLIANPPEWDGP